MFNPGRETHGAIIINSNDTWITVVTRPAHAHTNCCQTDMALREGAQRLNLLVNSRNFYKFTSFVGVRSLSENVSSKPERDIAPQTLGDHLIYTQEHFALKESLKKVCRTANISYQALTLP